MTGQYKETHKKNTQVLRWTNRSFKQFLKWINVWAVSICSGVILVHFLQTSGCIQDPISLTSQWITAAAAGFTSICTVKKKRSYYTHSLFLAVYVQDQCLTQDNKIQ